MTRSNKTLGVAAAGALAALLSAPTPARAITVADLQAPNACRVVNGVNTGLNLADLSGYHIHARSGGSGIQGGVLNIHGDLTLTLPPDGIICVKALTCTGGGTLRFVRNQDNTPAYLFVEQDATLSAGCDIDVSGQAPPAAFFGIGMDRLGGLGGPGGSDGGSCDKTWSDPMRAGEGIGPGGGKASTVGPGGGGASPVADGAPGHGAGGAAGGTWYSGSTASPTPAAADDRFLHGGSGGGCGGVSGGALRGGGGGGGGVFVLGVGGTLTINAGSEVRARGGSAIYGGGGGGGVVRLVATTLGPISGGATVVTGGATCGSTTCGGAGGDGYAYVSSGDGLEVAPILAERPTLRVTSVTGTFHGAEDTVLPRTFAEGTHAHRNTGVALDGPDAQVITVALRSVNVAHDRVVKVRLNAVYDDDLQRSFDANATTVGTGSGTLDWTADLVVPPDMKLGTVEAWVCSPTPGVPCNPQ